jgi:hypothetical protein
MSTSALRNLRVILGKTSQAFSADSIGENLKTSPLQSELDGHRVAGLPSQHLGDGQDLPNFPRPRKGCALYDPDERLGQPLEVSQRERSGARATGPSSAHRS